MWTHLTGKGLVESSNTQLEGVVQNDKSNQESPLGGLIEKYSEVFEEGLGTFKGPKVTIQMDPEARKDTRWHWGKKQMQAFQKSKELLKSSRLLVNFDSQKELKLACEEPYSRIEWMMVQSTQLRMFLGHCPMQKEIIPI